VGATKMANKVAVSEKDVNRIWGKAGFRLFLSHKSGVRAKTAKLSTALQHYGVSAFVAHDAIHPTREWQAEIELALRTMDGLAALMTEDFHTSNWTDQEIGCAVGRDVPVVPVNMGTQPYGFIGKFQSVQSDWDQAPVKIVKALIRHDDMLDAYIEAVAHCRNFDVGNKLAEILPAIDELTYPQVKALVACYNQNGELKGSFGFNGRNPRYYGPGLASHLNAHLKGRIAEGKDGTLRIKPKII
jgi:hypothetical protein